MTTKYLDRILEIECQRNRTITCEAGVTLEQIHKALWEVGLTLDTAPAVDWVTIGGSISTASHGSGPASNLFSMIGCRLVTADGEVIEIGEDDERLDAVRVSMGALGVLSTVTLKVVDAFYVSMQRIRIPTQDWKRYLTEGEMSYLLWFPHTEYSVLAKVDVIRDRRGATKGCGSLVKRVRCQQPRGSGTPGRGYRPGCLRDRRFSQYHALDFSSPKLLSAGRALFRTSKKWASPRGVDVLRVSPDCRRRVVGARLSLLTLRWLICRRR